MITVKKDPFQPKSIEITVKDGLTTEETITLVSNAVNVKVETQPAADIYLDSKFVGAGNYSGIIAAGVTTFEARKEGYLSDKKDIELSVGEPVIINLTVQPIYGNLDVVSTPIDAKVFLNGQERGITPITLQKLIIGNYELKLEKAGYIPKIKTVTIAENKNTELKRNA